MKNKDYTFAIQFTLFSQKENIRFKDLSAQIDLRTVKGAAVTHTAVFSNLVLSAVWTTF